MGTPTHHNPGIDGRERGFTLLELMVALSIAGVLVTIAIPSYQSLIQRNAMAANVNDLVGDLNYARSEAVTRGRRVYLCQSTGGHTCETKGNAWSQGWIVYAPDAGSNTPTADNLLRVHGALKGQITIISSWTNQSSLTSSLNNQVYFTANGFAPIGPGTLTASAADTARKKQIAIARTGRIETDDVSPES